MILLKIKLINFKKDCSNENQITFKDSCFEIQYFERAKSAEEVRKECEKDNYLPATFFSFSEIEHVFSVALGNARRQMNVENTTNTQQLLNYQSRVMSIPLCKC